MQDPDHPEDQAFEHPLNRLQALSPRGSRIAGGVLFGLFVLVPLGTVGLAIFHGDLEIFFGGLTTALAAIGVLYVIDPDWMARSSHGDHSGLAAHYQGFFGRLSWRLQTWLLETSPRPVRRAFGVFLFLLGIALTCRFWADVDVVSVVQGWVRSG